jgi:anti-sigma28 factor (negative regulator of flagellin synthesis)
MKIADPHVNVESTARVSTEAGAAPSKALRSQGSDAVCLSSGVQLAERVLRAATADDDRSAVVDRLRELHERGELDVDVDRLADRMIDALTHSNDHD